MNRDIIVFDIETKKSFDDVGGRDKMDQLGISVLGAYSYKQDKYTAFEEHELDDFKEMLNDAEVLIGFNIKGFDIPVLEPYISMADYNVNLLDLMDDVVSGAGFRISLDNLAGSTLGISKSADGLQALKWYKEGKIDEIRKYCLQDVKVTRALYEYGKKYGQVLFHSRDQMRKMPIRVSWGSPIQKDVFGILRDGFNQRKSVEISYSADTGSFASKNSGAARIIDIHYLKNDAFGGYCHTRKANRTFRIDKVVSARITNYTYKITGDVQDTLF